MNGDLFINNTRFLAQNWELILAILAAVSWETLLTFAILKKITGTQFGDKSLIALALSGWPLPALLISASVLALSFFIPVHLISIITLAFIIISTGFAVRAVWRCISLDFFVPVIIFIFFVFMRLGFSANLVLPSYFDSAEHYRIIQSLINKGDVFTTSYYHVGYHVIVAAFLLLTRTNPGQVMLFFGQIILAAIPMPMYFFIHRITNSNSAAFWGMTLAAFGWFMPAHAVNWGKYPALLVLLLIQFTLGAALIKNRLLFAAGMAASIIIHSRSIILLGIFGAAWIISAVPQKKLIFALTSAMLGMAILLIMRNQVIGPIFEPYGIWVTLLVGILAASVFRSFPRLIVISMLAMLFMLAAMFIPVTSVLTLLDRPLVEMTFYLPLAFLGGLGATRLPKLVVIGFAVVVIIHAWATYNFGPSECCQLVSRDDAVALDWMDNHTPASARVAISTADLSLNAFGSPMSGAGADAGVWIAPLTGRTTLTLPYSTDFAIQSTYDLLCQQQVDLIYFGNLPRSFNRSFADTKPEWYKTIFSLPEASIVQILDCK